jgi:ABC-type Fe3+ transport system permease subunit
MDGASPFRVFINIILPLLRPAIVTVIVTSAVGIYNDFVGPLYFLPGSENVTAQLTLFSFMSQFNSQWNLLFADVLVITVLPLIMFMFFQRQIVSGMTTGQESLEFVCRNEITSMTIWIIEKTKLQNNIVDLKFEHPGSAWGTNPGFLDPRHR